MCLPREFHTLGPWKRILIHMNSNARYMCYFQCAGDASFKENPVISVIKKKIACAPQSKLHKWKSVHEI